MMPQMDGIECCRRIRKLGYEGKLLVVSALIDAEIKQSALDAGVDRYISKSEIFDQLEIIDCFPISSFINLLQLEL
ncbi:MAG: hypothetical protein RL242_3010, partial [Pseudomonadota bacterium]